MGDDSVYPFVGVRLAPGSIEWAVWAMTFRTRDELNSAVCRIYPPWVPNERAVPAVGHQDKASSWPPNDAEIEVHIRGPVLHANMIGKLLRSG